MKLWDSRSKISVLTLLGLGVASVISVGTASLAHAATNIVPNSPSYVALGDSIAAGAGLPATGLSDDALCGRSSQSYPNLLATYLQTSVTNLSCSGAKASYGLIGAQTIGTTSSTPIATEPSQLDRAFQTGKPDLITITIGANDVNWVQLIGKCYVDTCGTAADTAYAKTLRGAFELKLGYTLAKIKSLSGSVPPTVLVTGYYYPVSSTSCLNGQVTATELAWINSQTDKLNEAIQKTVSRYAKVSSWFKSYPFTTFVPVTFAGHGLCSNEPWVQGLSDPAPLHPTAAGARQIASNLYWQIR